MKNIITMMMCIVIGGNIAHNTVAEASKPLVYQREPDPPRVVLIEARVDWTEERIKEEVRTQAEKYGVSEEVMDTVIQCESEYNKEALGDGGKSRGLVQIHADYHDVSDEEAYDPAFAIEFLAKHLKEGNGYLWTCYRMNYD
jgi:soluble lytic murein transglycosylase-like protein